MSKIMINNVKNINNKISFFILNMIFNGGLILITSHLKLLLNISKKRDKVIIDSIIINIPCTQIDLYINLSI